jgi:hypothetical protein
MQACLFAVFVSFIGWSVRLVNLKPFGGGDSATSFMCHTLNVHTLLLQSLYWHTL